MSKVKGWRNRATGKVDDTVTATKDTRYCQQCKHHMNNPSRCHERQIHVPRKDSCSVFVRR